MYPGTVFEIEDRSDINPLAIADTTIRPVFAIGITSDKGNEDYMYIKGSPFFKQFGEMSFVRHGQPLIQAANIINSGGELYVKRVVAPDSTLASVGVVALVSKASVPKVDASGLPLYLDASGAETTVALGGTPITIQQCKIEYQLVPTAITGNSLEDLAAAFLAANPMVHVLGTSGIYPLFVIADVGRGVSKKKFRITPDYNASRSTEYAKYIFEVLENNNIIESMAFAINPDVIEKNKNISLQNVIKEKSSQLRCKLFDDSIMAMIENIADISSLDVADLEYQDVLFGKDIRGQFIDNIIVDTTVDLRTIYGTPLTGGSNGSFGNYPLRDALYPTEMAKVFNGKFNDDIYNLDNTKIDVIVDANYPDVVKRAIEGLVNFREDCLYFRDLGIGLKSIPEITLADAANLKSRYCASYHNSYDVIDPYSRKQITVTIGYSLVRPLVQHFLNGRSLPFAGILHNVVFPEAIEGTINFVPKITPAGNQKVQLEDLRINFASYYEGVLVMETLYTSQERYTQLSFLNNVLSVQEVIKAIRSRCPKIRYSFIDGKDLERYKDDVQTVVDKFVGNFSSITLEYGNDPTYANNKIFYAVIKVKFRNFVQAEYFKVIALPS